MTEIFYFIILIFSIIVHEVMHGLIAEREGDPTARILGRITLNPLKHIDWFGSVILPLILVVSHSGFIVGWAKPVPYNPDNVRNGRKSVAKIAAAGPLINIAIGLFFSIVLRILFGLGVLSTPIKETLIMIIATNLALAVFNLLPFAPLDGFNILQSLLPFRFNRVVQTLQQFSMPLLLLFLAFGSFFFQFILIRLLLVFIGKGPFL